MIKNEALQAMQEGKKVTHQFFTENEWMTMRKDGKIVFEDGIVCSPELFWIHRTGASWEDGYSIVEQICYKSNEICPYQCHGLCKESC